MLLSSYHPGGNNFLTFREWLNPKTDHVYETGDIIKRPILADTLEKLANSPDPVQRPIMSSFDAAAEVEGGDLLSSFCFNLTGLRARLTLIK